VKVLPRVESLVGTKPEKKPPARKWHGSANEDCVTVSTSVSNGCEVREIQWGAYGSWGRSRTQQCRQEQQRYCWASRQEDHWLQR
jgi:hypothetical protein